jgi:hypothetical protein
MSADLVSYMVNVTGEAGRKGKEKGRAGLSYTPRLDVATGFRELDYGVSTTIRPVISPGCTTQVYW